MPALVLSRRGCRHRADRRLVRAWPRGAHSAPARPHRRLGQARSARTRPARAAWSTKARRAGRCARRRRSGLHRAAGGTDHRTAAGNRAPRCAGRAGHRRRQHQARRLRGRRESVFPARALSRRPSHGRQAKIPASTRPMRRLFRGAQIRADRAADVRRGSASPSSDARIANFVRLLEAIGARPMWMDAATHDRAAAVVSHLPQLVAVALAGVVARGHRPDRLAADARGPRAARRLRLAGSPYSVWRDIVLTNTDQSRSRARPPGASDRASSPPPARSANSKRNLPRPTRSTKFCAICSRTVFQGSVTWTNE